MSFFSKFPTTYYSITGTQVKTLVTDILRRIKVKDEVLSNGGYYYNYIVKDGERPETIADKLYGSADLHWVILIMNDIIDPYFDWILSTNEYEEMVIDKYPGYSLLFSINGMIFDVSECTVNAKFSTTTLDGETNLITQTGTGATGYV